MAGVFDKDQPKSAHDSVQHDRSGLDSLFSKSSVSVEKFTCVERREHLVAPEFTRL